jgi:hypothetical protein
MNYMINDPASKQMAIEFAKWTVMSGMHISDLTFEEQFECWVSELDNQATDEVADDTVDMDAYDDFERQLEYMAGEHGE